MGSKERGCGQCRRRRNEEGVFVWGFSGRKNELKETGKGAEGEVMKCLQQWEGVPRSMPGQSIGGQAREGADNGDGKGGSGGVER